MMNKQLTKLVCFSRAWLNESAASFDQRDAGVVTEETAMRVVLVGAAIAAATAIGIIIANNVEAIPSPG